MKRRESGPSQVSRRNPFDVALELLEVHLSTIENDKSKEIAGDPDQLTALFNKIFEALPSNNLMMWGVHR